MKGKFKTTKRYRLTFVNENTFNAVWTIKLSRAKVWFLSLVTVAAITALILWMILATPRSNLLPGYLLPSQRAQHINNTLRVDSLSRLTEINSAYLNNIARILGDEEPDSIAAITETQPSVVSDTLIETSAAERKFVEQWSARERYNLSVLTPLAADAMSFHSPVAAAVPLNPGLSAHARVKTLHLRVPRNAAVTAIYRGTVTDVHYDDTAGGYAVTVQHPNNFISSYAGLGTLFVERGEKLQSGDAIGAAPAGKLELDIWHNGSSVNPLSVIAF